MSDSKFLAVAKQAALKAGELIKKYSLSEHTLSGKGHFANFATNADVEAEKIITNLIKQNFPDHNIIGEEGGETINNSAYTWAIDPIDGTIPFVDGMPVYGVSIGLMKNHQAILGVINMVALGDLYWAEEGKGAFKNGQKISVRIDRETLQQSTVALDLGHTDRQMKIDKYFLPIIDKVRYPYCLGSAVLAVVYISSGVIDGYISKANIWDFLAGIVLVKEAGGQVTNYQGRELDLTKRKFEALFSNGKIHNQLVEIYK